MPQDQPPRETTPAPRKPRVARALIWLAAAIVLLVLLLAAAALVATQTEWGARMAWRAAERFLPGQLSGEVVDGTLSDGIRLRDVAYRTEDRLVQIDRLEGQWRLSRSPLLLTVRDLRIGTVEVTQLAEPPPDEPMTLPASLKLPLEVDLQRASIQKILMRRDDATTAYTDILLRASSDGVQHALDLERAGTPWGTAAASLRLNGEAPFEIGGTTRLEGEVRDERYRADARLSGTLRELGIQLDASGANFDAQAQIAATPFADVPLRRAQISMHNLDPSAFNPDWPQADIELQATLSPVERDTGQDAALSELAVAGPVTLSNAQPGATDKGLLPLASARADVTLDAQRQQLSRLAIVLPGGAMLEGSGVLHGADQGKLELRAKDLDLHALHTALGRSQLDGPLTLALNGDTQHLDVELADRKFSISADADLAPQQIVVNSAQLQGGRSQLELSGTLARGEQSAYAVSGKLTDFNPALFLASVPVPQAGKQLPAGKSLEARINMSFDAQGALRPEPSAKISFDIRNSTYQQLPMTGGGTVHFAGQRVLPSDARISIAGNRASLEGSFGAPSDRLQVDIDAPALGRLGFGLSGLLRLDGTIAGTVDRPEIDARFRAQRLAIGDYRVARLSGEARTQGLPGMDPDARISLDLDARSVHAAAIDLERLAADIEGTYAQHTIDASAAGRLRGRPLDLTLAAQGSLREQPQGLAWDGTLRTLQNRGFPQLSLAEPMPLAVAPGSLDIGSTRLSVEQAQVELEGLHYADGAIRSAGRIRALEIAQLLELRRQLTGAAAPVSTDLVLDAAWNVTLAERADGFVQVERRRGDIRLGDDTGAVQLGLSALSARADLRGTAVELQARASAARLGSATASGRIALQQQDGHVALVPDAPLSGQIEAAIPRLQTLSFLTGPDIGLEGSVALDLTVNGTLRQPRLSGTINGDRLLLALYEQGVRLRDGTARLFLEDNVVEIRELVFRGGDGELRVTGRVPLQPAAGETNAIITADKLQLLSSPSARLTLSGQARATDENRQLQIAGEFTVDRALISLPEKSAPQLGDDVIVIRGGRPPEVPGKEDPLVPEEQPPGFFSPRVNILLHLGDDFRFAGSGADLLLAGMLRIRSAPGETPQAFGTVRVVKGSYEAFGAELAIERGILNFQGSFSNPNVNILAMRRDQDVAAGVQVSGTVQRPRVQLVSEPDVSEEEKLSWLVFGRGTGAATEPGQAQNAARSAAFALLNRFGSERIAESFGLDEFSIGKSEYGLAGQQVVNLAKEISDRLSIGYEQSLAGAESVLKLTYELSRHWSVVLRGGAITGIDMFYSKRFDRIKW